MDIKPASHSYTIQECVGRGNFGDVYKATDNRTQTLVAIKVVNLEYTDEDIDLLSQEIFFLAELRSPYITNYLTTIIEDVSMWIIMEFCGGGSCSDLLKYCYKTGMPECKVSYIIKHVILGLQYLHEQKKIHRDIKAANILLTDLGHIKLGDFGVSGQMKSTLKKDTFVGTPYWMAPEVINRDLNDGYNEKADIWSLGITTYELLKGLPPLSKYDPLKVMTSLVKRKPPKLHGPFNDFTKNFIANCLIKNPTNRPNSTALLSFQFIKYYEDKINDLQDDVQIFKNIKSKEKSCIKRPKFALDDKFYNTHNEQLNWNFNSLSSMKPQQTLISPSSDFSSSQNLSPISQNQSPTQHDIQTVTPLTMESNTQRSFKKILINPYDLGSGMDIDSEKPPDENDLHQQQQQQQPIDSNKNNIVTMENLDYFKSVITYCLKRMNDRANDQDTKNRVDSLLYTFKLTESQVPGFSEVFMEEILLRMENIKNYVTHK